MWAFESTFYQIYPIGFCGAPLHNDGIQEHRIKRVAEWADYLEELGVGAVLLNPVFESSAHGYDTRDFTKIDCRLGTNDDFVEVVRELHDHGIRVVLDAVFNHVGREFWAFQDVREKRWDSPYRDWFFINFEGDSAFGDGFWYEGWEGCFDLVKLNLRNPAVVEYLLDIVRAWRYEFDIDGLRLDVAYSLDHDFIRRLRQVANDITAASEPGRDFVLIGETLHGDYSQIVNDGMLHSCTNYECYKGLYSSFNSQNMFEIAHSLHRQFGGDPWCIYRGLHLLSFADNHDVTRLASILTEPRAIRPAYGVLFGMPGIPCLYYGSEWGQAGVKGAHDDYDLRPEFVEPEPNELTEYLKGLIAARADSRALNYGSYRNVVITNKQLLFERAADMDGEHPAERVLVAVNAVDEPFTLQADELRGSFADLLDRGAAPVELDGSLKLAPFEVRWLRSL
ncbi:alpha-amylase family glycosyl hydrolase [Collinsella ihumii]|uniref:alpha-amylase family glycosyl hydrolase n=1 Tax=Collinsella ihumii TaxID=1720204 RepID=UPI00082EF34E|nr:alpha-amylase family glycosyl hydrolase [Collinsella ihumii]